MASDCLLAMASYYCQKHIISNHVGIITIISILASKALDCNYLIIVANFLFIISNYHNIMSKYVFLALGSSGLLASQVKMTNYLASRDRAACYARARGMHVLVTTSLSASLWKAQSIF